MKVIIILLSILGSMNTFAQTEIFGYFDMEKSWATGRSPRYDQHHLNIMLQHETSIFQFFAEIEYEHGAYFDTSMPQKGKILVERAWAQALISTHFNIKTGIFLSPTTFAQNHFPSITHTIEKPAMNDKVLNTTYEGIMAYGKIAYGFDYHFWHERAQDFDGNQLDGANWGGKLNYSIQNSDLNFNFGLVYSHFLKEAATGVNNDVDYDIHSFLFDLQMDYKNYTLWFEFGKREDSVEDDADVKGYYLFLSRSFETSFGELTPVIRHERFHDENNQANPYTRRGIGLNYRPDPNISIKMEMMERTEYNDDSNNPQEKSYTGTLGFVYMYR